MGEELFYLSDEVESISVLSSNEYKGKAIGNEFILIHHIYNSKTQQKNYSYINNGEMDERNMPVNTNVTFIVS